MFVIECKAPPTTPIDWYHVGIRDTEQEAVEAIERHKSMDRVETEWRYRRIGS